MKLALAKIKGIAAVNQEIIARIKAKKRGVTKSYHYGVKSSAEDCTLFLTEFVVETPAETLINNWSPMYKMEPYEDTFNAKINLTGRTFSHQERLNREFAGVALKYHIFLESNEKAIAQLEPIKANLGHITANLGTLEAVLADDVSSKAVRLKDIKKANIAIRKALSASCVTVGIPSAVFSSSIMESEEMERFKNILPKRMTLGTIKRIQLASDDGWSLSDSISQMLDGFLILFRCTNEWLIGAYSRSCSRTNQSSYSYALFKSSEEDSTCGTARTEGRYVFVIGAGRSWRFDSDGSSLHPAVRIDSGGVNFGGILEFSRKNLTLDLSDRYYKQPSDYQDLRLGRSLAVDDFEVYAVKK